MLALLAASVLSQSTSDAQVHVVEKKEYSDKGHFELTLFPAAVQVNGKFTQHLGAAIGLTYHLHENFAVTAMGLWNYVNQESGFNNELMTKVNVEAATATSLLLSGGALGGVEVVPFYGKFAVLQTRLIHFAIVLNGMAGAGATRHSLKPGNGAGPATFGDTGWRFMAGVGGGVRVKFAQWFSVRLEVRDVLYSASVNQVNGCGRADLAAIDAAQKGGTGSANVSGGCNDGSFKDASGRYTTDASIANNLVKNPSSDVLNNVGFYAGLSLDL